MLRKNEPKSTRVKNGLVLILGVLFIAVILIAICAWSVILLIQQMDPRPTPPQVRPVISAPTASSPTAMPASHFLIHLPAILSGSGYVTVSDPSGSVPVTDLSGADSISEQIWEVTEINNLGYELDNQYYDLATFTRRDGQDTVTAYCINRGWDVPDIGAEYLLNEEGIFVPLHESDTHPLQRFLRIR